MIIQFALNGISAPVLIIGALVLGGALSVWFIGRTIGKFLTQIQNMLPVALLGRLKKELDSGEFDRRLQAPVSLSGMDRIYGPMIHEDFPELNLEEMKRRAERLACSTLTAIDTEDLSVLSETGDLYRANTRQYLENLQSRGQHEHYSDVTIHRIVLSDYQKRVGTCLIRFQMSVGAIMSKTDGEGLEIEGQGEGVSQFKIEIEALYIQDVDQLASPSFDSLAFNCPNCGAPVSTLGERKCAYCGSAIEPLNIRVWTFSSFKSSLF